MVEAADLIRSSARDGGYEERTVLNVEKGFDWGQLREAGANLSLFSSKRLIELRLNTQKPGREGGAALTDYADNPPTDNVLLITSNKIDKKTRQSKWFKALDKKAGVIQIWPVGPAQLPGWVRQRCKQHNKAIHHDAAAFIAQRVEGNLLAAKQEIDKLVLLVDKPEIDSNDVLSAVIDSARFDVFALNESVFLGQVERVARMLRGLKNEAVEPVNIYAALIWEFRRVNAMAHEIAKGKAKEQVFAAYRIWQQKKPAMTAVINRFNARQLAALLTESITVDKAIKGVIKADSWLLLERFMFAIAGQRLKSPPSA